MSFTSGRRVGPYVVEAPVAGDGGSGRWTASEPGMDRQVLLTVTPLPADATQRDELRDRLRRRAALEHRALLPVYEVGEEEGFAWLATRAPQGRPSSAASPLGPERGARAVEDLESALVALAGTGLAPRRIGPEDVVIEGDRAFLLPGDLDGGTDSSAAEADLGRITAGLTRSGRRSRTALLAGVAVAVVACLAVLVVVLATRGESEQAASADAPVATVAAKIPLGVSPRGVAVVDGQVWVGSGAGVLRIDPATNEVVGGPIPVGRDLEVLNVEPGDGVVWAAVGAPEPGSPGAVVRIDASSGRVTGRVAAGAGTADVREHRDLLWIARLGPAGPELVRHDARSLAAVGEPIPLGEQPTRLAFTDEHVWVSDLAGEVMRVPLDGSGPPTPFIFGGAGFGAVADGGVLWVPDIVSRSVSAYDAASGRPLADSAVFEHQVTTVRATEDAIWATTVDAGLYEIDGPVDLVRVDPVSRAAVGEPVRLGDGFRGIAVDDGSVWVPTASDETLWRLEPSPIPLAAEPPDGPSSSSTARTLTPGPLGVGPRTSTVFAVPFRVAPSDERWLAIGETTEVVDFVRYDEPEVRLSLVSAQRLFQVSGRLEPLQSADQLLDRLRSDPSVTTEPLPPVRVGDATARGLRVRVRDVTVAAPCPGLACIRLLPIEDGSFFLLRKEGRVDDIYAADVSGRVLIVDLEQPADRPLTATPATLEDLGLSWDG
ncbi:hypothetical protein [Miltoncostaea oceani]|uniref:hypothetical protein n=1 Tax=Miltoncostaea oceani TaxID=2843216 RepID=UPI001C3D43C9|nr:hypothetical protein [Miltoncostaea oceani]